jgi:hypothetical protein
MLTYTSKEPVGVVGSIIPWNNPTGAAIWKIAPVPATGCTMILKSADEPRSRLRPGRHRWVNDERPVELDPVPLAPALREATNDELVAQLAARARAEGLQLTGEGGLLSQLTKRVVESALEGELDDHQGYGKHDATGRDGGTSRRNGKRAKTVLTEAVRYRWRCPVTGMAPSSRSCSRSTSAG